MADRTDALPQQDSLHSARRDKAFENAEIYELSDDEEDAVVEDSAIDARYQLYGPSMQKPEPKDDEAERRPSLSIPGLETSFTLYASTSNSSASDRINSRQSTPR